MNSSGFTDETTVIMRPYLGGRIKCFIRPSVRPSRDFDFLEIGKL